jgi:hypothetical protein
MGFVGKFDGTSNDKVRIRLDADAADITAGGEGRGGDVLVTDDLGRATVKINGGGKEGGLIPTLPTGPGAVVTITGDPGSVVVRDPNPEGGAAIAILRGREQGEVSTGELTLGDGTGKATITLRAAQGDDASVIVGGEHRSGWMVLRNASGKDAAFLSGHEGAGQVQLRDADQNNALVLRAVDGDCASIVVGETGRAGWIVLRNGLDRDAVFMSGNRLNGLVELRALGGDTTVRLEGDGSGWFGGRGHDGTLLVFPADASGEDEDGATVAIMGRTGDIVLRNADCAEEFEVDDDQGLGEGAVVSLGENGRLRLADQPYDRRVAGVISGAGGLRPGIVLGRQPGASIRWPVALAGKVYCRVDATSVPVAVGDLLTTSDAPGHAMAVADHGRAFGAVLGKAIEPLRSGRGLIPVLVALQ